MIVILDTSPLGRITNPNASPTNDTCKRWLKDLLLKGVKVTVPEISDYELHRELLRANKTAGLQRLNQLASLIGYAPITTPTMLKASELWANIRNLNLPTASDDALDGDVILAAQAIPIQNKPENIGERVIVATENLAHLSRLTDADEWQNITA